VSHDAEQRHDGSMSTKRTHEPTDGPRFKDGEDLRRHLGQRLKELRNDKDVSQEDLAGSAGMSPRQVQNLEAGKKASSIDAWFAVARALGVGLEELLRPTGSSPLATHARERRAGWGRAGKPRRSPVPEIQIDTLASAARQLDAKTVAALIHLARGYRSR
jgi:transcriptional regulator with XRE-family HTH domain